MNELIKIEERNGEQLVSGRDLHKFLKVKTEFKIWISRIIDKYNFIENKDFVRVYQKCNTLGGEQEKVNYMLKIAMAKEVAMVSNTPKGKQAREYFIKCEEAWNSDDMIMARALQIQNKKIIGYKERIEALEYDNLIKAQQIAELKPIKDYIDTILSSEDTMTITQIGADYGKTAYELNKILHEQGIIRNVGGQWILYKEHMNKGYTKSETITVKRKDGTEKVVSNTKWTQKGRLKIHEILTVLGIKANQDKENEKKFKSSDDIHLGIFYYKKIKVR